MYVHEVASAIHYARDRQYEEVHAPKVTLASVRLICLEAERELSENTERTLMKVARLTSVCSDGLCCVVLQCAICNRQGQRTVARVGTARRAQLQAHWRSKSTDKQALTSQ